MKFNVLKLETVQAVVALLCSLFLPIPARAVPPSIGTADAKGSFRVDDATVAGNATLFEGATVETHQSSSTLDLASGARLSLAPESKGRIFSDRLILERGSGQMEKAVGFRMEARGLTVRMENGAGSARVALAGSARVQVAALAGSVRVLNSQGLVVAAIHSGNALEFAFQVSGAPTKLSGCLRTVSGHYLVTDEVTNVTVEVAGPGLGKEGGNRVQITGAMDPAASPVSGATEYIRVNGVKRLSRGCAATDKAAAAGAGGGGTPGGVGTAARNGHRRGRDRRNWRRSRSSIDRRSGRRRIALRVERGSCQPLANGPIVRDRARSRMCSRVRDASVCAPDVRRDRVPPRDARNPRTSRRS